tara:strand:+ start:44 stop:235 length:192 start_codon:yes stop_codon:yes gene_type:complete
VILVNSAFHQLRASEFTDIGAEVISDGFDCVSSSTVGIVFGDVVEMLGNNATCRGRERRHGRA